MSDPPRPEATGNVQAAPDVAAILAKLREEVRERSARLARRDPDNPHARNLAELRRSVDAVNDNWFVSAHLPVMWQVRVFGRLLAYTKRVVRLLLRWYINPIVEQQNGFNSATARAFIEMSAYQERMTREWLLLEERVARLEKLVAGGRLPVVGDQLMADDVSGASTTDHLQPTTGN